MTVRQRDSVTVLFAGKTVTLSLCLTLLIFFLPGCTGRQQGEVLSETRLLLDTYCTITIHGDVDQKILDEAFALCAELEALFSITVEGSDVWQINHNAGEFIIVDPRTLEVINAGLEFGDMSGGMFDIAIGRLTRLWDFGSGKEFIPSEVEIALALGAGSYRNINITADKKIVWINPQDSSDDGAWIDLGAIAKGYIADLIAVLLEKHGVAGALIDLGGDVVTIGNRPDGGPWRIALKKPFGSMEEFLGVFEITGVSVVSSGIYERQFEKDGILYHHILDPNTGKPVSSDVISATVIAESALTGEGLSTIAILVGSEKVPDIFEKTPGFIGAVLVLDNGELLKFGDMVFIR